VFRRKAEVLQAERTVRTTCPYCEVSCGMNLHAGRNNIVRGRGESESPATLKEHGGTVRR
jgi:anaerobic selenocysteine-containing dehydrogenase